MNVYYRNTDPTLSPASVCKVLEVKSAVREDGGRVVRVEYENSDRVDGFVECYVFGDSMVLSTLNESFVGPVMREYFARWYRRCNVDGKLLDI